MNSVGSSGQTIGNTVTAGIQDISALLPLLGTEQCEDHVASALTNGFLYTAAAPISLFGSLGVARAGFKTLMAAINISPPKHIPWLRFEGAKMLVDAGFKPHGLNMPLIMLNENRKSYHAETRLESMLKDLHIRDSNRIVVHANTLRWNIIMIIASGFFSTTSIAPYVHLNLHEPNQLSHFVRWAFPIMRAIGGFLVTTMVQLVIQSRLLTIVRKRLILHGLREEELVHLGIDVNDKTSAWVRYPSLDQRFSVLKRCVIEKLNPSSNPFLPNEANPHVPHDNLSTTHRHATDAPPSSIDIEAAKPELGKVATSNSNELNPKMQARLKQLHSRISEATGSPVLLNAYLALLFLGIVGSITGYVGCFSAVQGSGSSKESLIWLILEATLSLIRIILWGTNPRFDDAPPLEFLYELGNTHKALPTCEVTAETIAAGGTFPLVRAQEFLESVTSYAGFLRLFTDPRLTLYYTLTLSNYTPADLFSKSSGGRALYITIFDHTEQTTRVYTENGPNQGPSGNLVPSYFWACSGVNIGPVPTTNLTNRIVQECSAITMDKTLRTALAEHYHSILDQIDERVESGMTEYDVIQDDWKMMFEESKHLMQSRPERRAGLQGRKVRFTEGRPFGKEEIMKLITAAANSTWGLAT